jgi:hypothetical protein
MHRTPLDLNTATFGQLLAEVLELRADLVSISAEFVREAVERDWCGDYDSWARVMNRKLSRPVFVDRYESGYGLEANAHDRQQPAPQPSAWCAACNMNH